MNTSAQRVICDMQGKLFEMTRLLGYDRLPFIRAFMTSQIASDLDSTFNHMQWAGKEYLMERIEDELKDKLVKTGALYDKETLYWMGYLYRYWHFYTGEASKDIYKQANASRMRRLFLPYHTLSNELAIDKLKER